MRQDLGAVLGVIADPDRALDVECGANEFFGIGIAPLLDHDARQSHDEARGRGIVFALLFQARQQHGAGIDLGLGETSLLGLHARDVQRSVSAFCRTSASDSE